MMDEKEKAKALELAVASVEKEFGRGAIMRLKDGEKIDLQIVVKKVNGEKEEVIWDSAKLGDNLREVGKQPVAVNWQETPFEISWDTGEQVVVEVWDRK